MRSRKISGLRVRAIGCDKRNGRRGCGFMPDNNETFVSLELAPGHYNFRATSSKQE